MGVVQPICGEQDRDDLSQEVMYIIPNVVESILCKVAQTLKTSVWIAALK
jgi:hypothetical protein